MTETKTVELPLTKSERRHRDNIRRRDANRKRSNARRMSQIERDEKLAKINADFGPKIRALQIERQRALAEVWAEWRDRRETETREEAAA